VAVVSTRTTACSSPCARPSCAIRRLFGKLYCARLYYDGLAMKDPRHNARSVASILAHSLISMHANCMFPCVHRYTVVLLLYCCTVVLLYYCTVPLLKLLYCCTPLPRSFAFFRSIASTA
jgi:hypothetical protein